LSVSFSSCGVPADLAELLAKRGIHEPYPVQAATLPDALEGLDVCAQSPTGSGKTLAFGIPLVNRVGKATPGRPRALVLAPTRELAAQIAGELVDLAQLRGRRVATFYGGVGFGQQLDALRRGVDIAVGCPGRLEDLVERRSLRLNDVEVVVVDEADRLSDMGFLPAVRRLLDAIGPQRQTLLFSATLQGDVERLIKGYQRSPKRFVLEAPTEDLGHVMHRFLRIEAGGRAGLTARLVAEHGSAIVFCRTKRGVDRLTRNLTQAGISAVPIHGDRTQVQRDRALAAFHARSAQVLVGTDVAARGIHVDDVACVVHFDPPEDESTYVHRSGRTGRAGRSGVVISLVTPEQESIARKLQKTLGMPVQFDQVGTSGGNPMGRMPSASVSAPNQSHDQGRPPQSYGSSSGSPRRQPRRAAASNGRAATGYGRSGGRRRRKPSAA
jgi:superfamily II DNA/RNA helicase